MEAIAINKTARVFKAGERIFLSLDREETVAIKTPKRLTEEQRQGGNPKMAVYKIMIIEDDPVIRAELKNMLCGNGYDAYQYRTFPER